MSSSTANLGLTLPADGERLSLGVLNQNWGKVDEFAGNANAAAITTQYTTLLAAVNAFRTTKTFPFSIQKSGNSAYTDLPPGITNTCEWNALCIGDAQRLTVILVIYTGAGSNNLTVWDENIYNGSVNRSWQEITDTNKTTYSGTANSNYISTLEGQVVRNGNVVSGYFVLTANADFSNANLTLISNIPSAYNQDVQLSCIGLSGTNIYKASRVKITTSGTIVTWYGFGFKSGESYLISVNYICA